MTPNTPIGRVPDDELLAHGERVVPGRHSFVGAVPGGLLGPEPERGDGVAEVGQPRVLVGLAGLRDHHLEDPLRVVEHSALRAPEHAFAPLEAIASQPR
jgi:hypothetical protein